MVGIRRNGFDGFLLLFLICSNSVRFISSNFTCLCYFHAVCLWNIIKIILSVPFLLYLLNLPHPLLLFSCQPCSPLIQTLHPRRRSILLRFIQGLMTLVTEVVSFMFMHSSL